jgi:hypothetical protein
MAKASTGNFKAPLAASLPAGGIALNSIRTRHLPKGALCGSA